MRPTRDNSIRDGNTQRLVRIESKLTKLMLHFGIDDYGNDARREPCQLHDFETEKQS